MRLSSVMADINSAKLVFITEEKCGGVKSFYCVQCHYVIYICYKAASTGFLMNDESWVGNKTLKKERNKDGFILFAP